MAEDLSTDVNDNVISGNDNPAVNSALKIINDNIIIRSQYEGEWDAIQDMFENGFEVSDPTGTRRIESQLLFQAIYKTVSKMKPLDVAIHGTGKAEETEKVVTDGLATVLKKGGFIRALRDKFGSFYRLLTYGDAFIRVGADTDSEFPIRFQNTSLSNIYVDPFATGMRNPAGENEVSELVAIYKYSWDEAIELYPDLKKKGGVGLINRGEYEDQQEFTQEQEVEQMKKEVEIAHYYNKSKKRYTIFAGSAHTVLADVEGKDYPFVKEGDAYIPFIHLMCFPASEGFYNHGLGHYIYKLATITRQLDNKAINYGMDNVDPIRMVNVPTGENAKFFGKLLAAQEAQAAGRKGFVVNEYNQNDPKGGQISVETFQAQPITQEWERLYTRLQQAILDIGINLKDVEITSATATERIASEENATQAVRQIMEQNASEFEFVWELSIDFIKKFITKNNKTIINMTTTVKTPDGGTARVDGITLGDIKEEVSNGNWFVIANARSGIYPSNTMQQAQVERTIAGTVPGSPAHTRLMVKLARLNDQDISAEELGQAQTPDETGALPTDTSGLAVQKGGSLTPAI